MNWSSRNEAKYGDTTSGTVKTSSKAEMGAYDFLQMQVTMVEDMDKTTGGMSKSVTEYSKALKDAMSGKTTIDDTLIKKLRQQRDAAVEVTTAYGSLATLGKDSADSMKSFFTSFAPLNAAESTMIKISSELKNMNKIIENAPKVVDIDGNESDNEEIYRLKTKVILLEKEHALILRLNQAEHLRKLGAMDAAEKMAEAGRMRHKVLKGLYTQEAKVAQVQDTQASLIAEQANLNAVIQRQTRVKGDDKQYELNAEGELVELTLEQTIAQQHQLESIQKKIDAGVTLLAHEKELLLFSQGTLKNQLATNAAKMDKKLLGFEKTMMTNENKRLQYAKERLKLLKQEREIALEGALRAERESNPFAYLSEEKRTAELKYEMAVANRVDEKALIEEEAAMKLAQNDVEYDLLRLKYILLDLEMEKIQAESTATRGDLFAKHQALEEKAQKNGGLDPDDFARWQALPGEIKRLDTLNAQLDDYGPRIKTLIDGIEGKDGLRQAGKDAIEGAATGKINKLDAAIEKLREAKDRLKDINVISDTIAHSFEENMTSAFTSLIQGTASAKEAFSNMAMSILKDISAMIVRMMVFRMLNSLFTGGGEAAGYKGEMGGQEMMPRFMPGERYGGIVEQGKHIPGYATGGIAKGSTSGYPAMLHGTEAVVPLGSGGRSIPVDLKGSGATNNNIVVNISSEGQSNTQGSTGPDMDKMGGAIAKAVQEELHNQKRSGGILNPYGAA